MKIKNQIILVILILSFSCILIGCNKSTIIKSDIKNDDQQNTNNYTAQELINKFQNDIQFGMSKEDIIRVMGRKPDMDFMSSSEQNGKGIVYNIKINSSDSQLMYAINENNQLASLGIKINKGDNYNKYVDDYKSIYQAIVNLYGEPTNINDKITNPSAKSYGYEIYNMKSKYDSEWDLDDKIINSLLCKFDEESDIVFQVLYKSKNYPYDM